MDIIYPIFENPENNEDYSMWFTFDELFEELIRYLSFNSQNIHFAFDVLKNNTNVATNYLNQANLLETKNDNCFKISHEGKKVIWELRSQKIKVIDLDVLKTHSFFYEPEKEDNLPLIKQDNELYQWEKDISCDWKEMDELFDEQMNTESSIDIDDFVRVRSKSYLESIKKNVAMNNEGLEKEVLKSLTKMSPKSFENFVMLLLKKMGYGNNFEVTGKPNDGGVDGILYRDDLGLHTIHVQAKRWKRNVGSPEIRDFIGSLDLLGSRKGILITTANFTKDAQEAAAKKNTRKTISLINGTDLVKYSIKYNIGVKIEDHYEIKVLDNDFFNQYR